MTEPNKHLLHWLRDAYAMEKQALEMCERQSERIENYPELKARITQHVEETKGQIARLDKCFEILGETPSAVKDAMGWTMGNMQAVGGMMMSDEIVKGSMASYVFENLEIASYTILIAAAEASNQPEIARLCREILEQEKDMAEWLQTRLPDTTQKFMYRDAEDMRARA
jgi:ferritin-like metal-binding protein YciE